MKTHLLSFLFSVIFAFPLLAQVHLQTGVGLSHTGYNYYLEAGYRWQEHELALGPKLLLSDTYLPTEGPWGLRLSYRYRLLEKKRWGGFVQLAYQVSWLDVYNPNQLPNPDRNRIHEGHVIYGFSWRPNDHWRIIQGIGVGGYQERLIDLIGDRISRNNGFSAWIGLEVAYLFTRRSPEEK